MSADLQGGSSRADRREEEVRPAGETEDSAAALVQPREEGLHEAPPRGARTRRTHIRPSWSGSLLVPVYLVMWGVYRSGRLIEAVLTLSNMFEI